MSSRQSTPLQSSRVFLKGPAPDSPWKPALPVVNLMKKSSGTWQQILRSVGTQQSNPPSWLSDVKHGHLAASLLSDKQVCHIRRVDSKDNPDRPGYFIREVATPERPHPNQVDFWICGDVTSAFYKPLPANGLAVVKLSKKEPLLLKWESYPSQSKFYISPFCDKKDDISEATVWKLEPLAKEFTSILIRGIGNFALRTLNNHFNAMKKGSDKIVTIEMMILDPGKLFILQLTVDESTALVVDRAKFPGARVRV